MINRILSYRNLILTYVFKLVPMTSNLFYFCSFHGQYNDSPRCISEALHKEYPLSTMVWEITEKCHEVLPNYVYPVYPGTIRAIWLQSRSNVVIDNYFGSQCGYANRGTIRHFLFTALKKRRQLNVCTWHGTALKHISLDEPSQKFYDDFCTTADLMTCGNRFSEQLFNRINYNRIPIVMCGTPRNDLLCSDFTQRRPTICKKLGLPTDKKIFLYAPTFRDDLEWSGPHQMEELDIPQLLSQLLKKFGGEWIFVVRLHDSVILQIDEDNLCKKAPGLIFNGNQGDDMTEYLAITDVLLTDYSSSFFDFALTKRPCFLYCPDKAHYGDIERGFYWDMDTLPFSVSETTESLYSNIENFSHDNYMKCVSEFLLKLGNVEQGTATQNIVSIIGQKMSTGEGS